MGNNVWGNPKKEIGGKEMKLMAYDGLDATISGLSEIKMTKHSKSNNIIILIGENSEIIFKIKYFK